MHHDPFPEPRDPAAGDRGGGHHRRRLRRTARSRHERGPGTNAVTITTPDSGLGGPQIPTISGNTAFEVSGKYSTRGDPNKGGVGITVELYRIVNGQPAGTPVAGKYAFTSTSLGQNNANWTVNIAAIPNLAAGIYSLRATMRDTNQILLPRTPGLWGPSSSKPPTGSGLDQPSSAAGGTGRTRPVLRFNIRARVEYDQCHPTPLSNPFS